MLLSQITFSYEDISASAEFSTSCDNILNIGKLLH